MSTSMAAHYIECRKLQAEQNYERIIPDDLKYPITKTKLPFDAMIICGRAEKTCDTYVGKTEENEDKRITLYKEEKPKEVKKIEKKVTFTILKENVAKNAVVMSITVPVFGLLGSLAFLASGPLAIIIGPIFTSAGIAIGGTAGGLIINHFVNEKIKIEIVASECFSKWRHKAVTEKVYPIFRNFVDTDAKFKSLLCPFSRDLCFIPLKAPDGITYNQSDIYAYIEKKAKEAGVTDPIQIEKFKIDSPLKIASKGSSVIIKFSKKKLLFDFDYCKNLIETSEKTYQEIKANDKETIAAYGLEAVIENTKDLMKQIHFQMYYKAIQEIKDKREKGLITKAEEKDIKLKLTAQWNF